jgi:IS1 family transposase
MVQPFGEGNPVANVLDDERRLAVLAALVQNSGVRGAESTTGVHRDTIGRFAERVGGGCARLHNRLVRDLSCAFVDMDEQHSWCFKRQQNIPEGADATLIGEQWTWAALCRTSKLTIAWCVGKRNAEHADELVAAVRARLATMPQITTDGCALYEEPIGRHFGYAVPYIQTIKNYTERPSRTATGEKYGPKRGVDFIQKRAIFGAPSFEKATTYAIERSNGTNRCWNARLNRRTLKFSKDLDRHKASVALMYVYRNLCHIQRNMKDRTAAMAAGVTDHVWDLAELMEAALAEPAGEKPTAQPLTIPKPATVARALPEGRGWLQVVGGNPAAPSHGPVATPPPPVAPAVPVAAVETSADPTGQLELLAWRPRPARPLPPRGTQLELFGASPEGGSLS